MRWGSYKRSKYRRSWWFQESVWSTRTRFTPMHTCSHQLRGRCDAYLALQKSSTARAINHQTEHRRLSRGALISPFTRVEIPITRRALLRVHITDDGNAIPKRWSRTQALWMCGKLLKHDSLTKNHIRRLLERQASKWGDQR